MARRNNSSSGASLDSLLDTMTNVVGILVIMLVVTQLGVRDAVKRISSDERINPETIAEARAAAASARTALQALEEQFASLQKPQQETVDLAQLQRQLNDQQADLEALLAAKKSAEEATNAELAEALERLQQQKREAEELLAKLTVEQDRLADLKAQLAKTPRSAGPPAKVVHLPNPRSAPEGAEPLLVICREGKVAFLDLANYLNRAERWTAAAVAPGRLGSDKTGYDCGKLFGEFNRQGFRDVNFELQLVAQGRIPMLEIRRRENWGETLEEIADPQSRYQSFLRKINPGRNYLTFLVWTDSFEQYTSARELASREDILAGWTPQTAPQEYAVRLPGSIRCGPPPPPPPKPKDPPKDPPQPPKNADPPREPLPENAID